MWPECEFEKNFQIQSISERSDLLGTKSRANEGSEGRAGQPPDRQGRAEPFSGLVTGFYSLKTKKFLAGRLALGNWLGCAFLPNMKSGSWLV